MKKRIVILVVSLIAITGIIVGVSYAFFSIGGSQEQANNFTSGCLNISLTSNSASINLTNTYPITDIEGLETTSYDFTITNTCSSETNYRINLESLNKQINSLGADYIKVALSSDTVDNVISKLSSNTSVTPEIDGAYESYNLYTGTLKGEESKTYHLKLWIDYDATKEEAANKTYQSKINVIASSTIDDSEILTSEEILFDKSPEFIMAEASVNMPKVKYCFSSDNICTPSLEPDEIMDNRMRVFADHYKYKTKKVSTVLGELEVTPSPNKIIMCAQLDSTTKTVCSSVFVLNPGTTSSESYRLDSVLVEGEDDYGTTYYFFEGTSTTVRSNNWLKFAGFYWNIVRINGNGSVRIIYAGKSIEEREYGTTYYFFEGTSTTVRSNNWLKFAGFYWNIVRINGNGSVRIIYAGKSIEERENDDFIQSSVFAPDPPNVGIKWGYIGYMRKEDGDIGNEIDSTVKQIIDQWYENNLLDFSKYLDEDVGFCGDRIFSNSISSFHERLNNFTPTFKCINSENDLYTISSAAVGNRALQYPIGMLSGDEVVFAGMDMDYSNNFNFLNSKMPHWTMTPMHSSALAVVAADGTIGMDFSSRVEAGIRPVVNLRSDIEIIGKGTVNDPYFVVGAE